MKPTILAAVLLSLCATGAGAQTQASGPPELWTVNTADVHSGMLTSAARYFEAAWLPARREALRRGDIKSFRILASPEESATEPEFVLITEYADPATFAAREARFDAIFEQLGVPDELVIDGRRRADIFASLHGLENYRDISGRLPADTSAAPASSAPNPAYAADVASMDAIIAALYDVISGDAGVPRDWDRFRSLFHPSAKLIPIAGPPITGSAEPVFTATFLSPDDYIARAEPFLMRGFHEQETARRTETFGHMTHVFSTYDSRRSASDAQPFARGINSIQLFDDGTRWWILSVYWQGETPTIQLPAEYLTTP